MLTLALILFGFPGLAATESQPADLTGWEAAKWGMTQQEVSAAFAGKARPYKKGDKTTMFYPDGRSFSMVLPKVTFEALSWEAHFGFSTEGRLVDVALTTTAEAASLKDLGERLKSRHGAPVSTPSPDAAYGVTEWLMPSSKATLTVFPGPPGKPGHVWLTYSAVGGAHDAK